MSNKKWGVVIPATQNRIENVNEVLRRLSLQSVLPDEIIVVCDGFIGVTLIDIDGAVETRIVYMEKYHPDGKHDQPRNVGVKNLSDDIDYVWFLDSDVIPTTHALSELKKAMSEGPDRILIAPYDWLPPGNRNPDKDLYNDPRWDMFKEYPPSHVAVGELNFALACFSGNLVWPVDKFKYVGGFWNEIHMGRCEDGELGLRASALGIPMSVVRNARGWHLDHPINHDYIHHANARDVPLLNKRHPWVQEKGIVLSEQDGARFDIVCPVCGEQINTIEIWEHPCQIH